MPRPHAPSRPQVLSVGLVLALVVPSVSWGLLLLVEAPAWTHHLAAIVGFLVLGGLLVRQRVVGTERERAAADAERQLAAERATLVQLVSSEFRTPLTMIRGGVETLVGRMDVDSSLQPVAEAVQRATERLEGMLGLVLAVTDQFEIEEHERIGTRLETVIADVVDELSPRSRSRVRTSVTAVAGVETHVARRGIVALLLQTVLDNALKFSPPGTPVDVRGHVGTDELVLEVIDRGPGLAPDFATRAFEMSTQQDASQARPATGLGMGLFTARRLTTRLGGRISLTDGPDGIGCVAEIRLPRVFTTDGPDAGAPEPADEAGLARR